MATGPLMWQQPAAGRRGTREDVGALIAPEPQPRPRGDLQRLVVAALGANQARGDTYGTSQLGLSTQQVTKAVNASGGAEVSRKVVLTVLQRLVRQGRVARAGARDRYLYSLTRELPRLQQELDRLEVEYGKVARAEFDRRARSNRNAG